MIRNSTLRQKSKDEKPVIEQVMLEDGFTETAWYNYNKLILMGALPFTQYRDKGIKRIPKDREFEKTYYGKGYGSVVYIILHHSGDWYEGHTTVGVYDRVVQHKFHVNAEDRKDYALYRLLGANRSYVVLVLDHLPPDCERDNSTGVVPIGYDFCGFVGLKGATAAGISESHSIQAMDKHLKGRQLNLLSGTQYRLHPSVYRVVKNYTGILSPTVLSDITSLPEYVIGNIKSIHGYENDWTLPMSQYGGWSRGRKKDDKYKCGNFTFFRGWRDMTVVGDYKSSSMEDLKGTSDEAAVSIPRLIEWNILQAKNARLGDVIEMNLFGGFVTLLQHGDFEYFKHLYYHPHLWFDCPNLRDILVRIYDQYCEANNLPSGF